MKCRHVLVTSALRRDMNFTEKRMHDLGAEPERTVSEVYSPPQVNEAARRKPQMGIVPGFAFDLTTCDERGVPWDFSITERRQEARRRVQVDKPTLLIGTPMCTRFCVFQHVNDAKKAPEEVRREHLKAMVHLRFVCELYREQVAGGRYFLHEHPETATSWSEECVLAVGRLPNVEFAVGDQCQYGQGDKGGNPLRKRTGWLSNSEEVLNVLGRQCSGRSGGCSRAGGGRHATCCGSLSKPAAVYPFSLCRSILQGIRGQMREDGDYIQGIT